MGCGNWSQCGYPGWRRQVGQALEVAAERQVARASRAERRSGPLQPGVGVRRSSLKSRPRLSGSTGGRGPGECDRAKGTGDPSPKWQGLGSAGPSGGVAPAGVPKPGLPSLLRGLRPEGAHGARDSERGGGGGALWRAAGRPVWAEDPAPVEGLTPRGGKELCWKARTGGRRNGEVDEKSCLLAV